MEATVMMAGLAEDDDGGAPLAAVASVATMAVVEVVVLLSLPWLVECARAASKCYGEELARRQRCDCTVACAHAAIPLHHSERMSLHSSGRMRRIDPTAF